MLPFLAASAIQPVQCPPVITEPLTTNEPSRGCAIRARRQLTRITYMRSARYDSGKSQQLVVAGVYANAFEQQPFALQQSLPF